MLKRSRLLNGAVLLAASVATTSCVGAGRQLSSTRGIILISIDTLRADHLSSYGYRRPTSPFLDSLASRGVLFENAFVHLPGTLPSHMSLFTSLYPAEHGVYPGRVLSEDVPTLPEILQQNGFRTAGFTEGGYVAGFYGFARGFDRFEAEFTGRHDDIERTLLRGIEFLRDVDHGERFFLFLNTYAAHDPYTPPTPYDSRYWKGQIPHEAFPPTGANFTDFNRGKLVMTPAAGTTTRRCTTAGINYVDDSLRWFFDSVGRLGLFDDVTVVITSDHGEEFLEHGKMVHEQIFPETLHVPLIVLHPALSGGVRPRTVIETVDIATTLYDIAGVPGPERSSGRSFVSSLLDAAVVVRTDAYSEAYTTDAVSLIHQSGDKLYQLMLFERPGSGFENCRSSNLSASIPWPHRRGLKSGVWMNHEGFACSRATNF